MITIWNKKTGEPVQREAVDAREILANSPEFYTDTDPATGKKPAPTPPVGVAVEVKAEPTEDQELADLRAQYASKFGKKAYHGWTADELREKLAAE